MTLDLDGKLVEPNGKGAFPEENLMEISNLLNQVDGVLPNSWLELKAIQADLNWKGKDL